MNRKTLVARFDEYLGKPLTNVWLGKKEVATYFGWYFKHKLADDFDATGIDLFLPKLAAEAMLIFKDSSDPIVETLRTKYLNHVRMYQVPDVLDIQADDYRLLLCNRVARLLAEVTNIKDISTAVEQYLLAQDNTLSQLLLRFNMSVWQTGLWNFVRTKPANTGHIGTFGKTTLGLYINGPTVHLTFVRLQENNSEGHSVCFTANITDKVGTQTDLSTIQVTLGTAMDMISDVIQHWPDSREEQSRLFADAMMK
jgi:hypothetical protein